MKKRANNLARVERNGFTLVEATVSVLLVSILLVATLTMVGAFAQARRQRQDQSRALMLAQELMGEIVQYAYVDPSIKGSSYTLGPDAGETRATFNDVDDFNGYSESPPAARNGTALPGFTGWKRAVQVAFVDPTNPSSVVTSDQGLKRITVTITTPTGKTTSLTALRGAYGLYEHTTTTATAFDSWVDLTLQAGTDSSGRVVSSVNTINQVP